VSEKIVVRIRLAQYAMDAIDTSHPGDMCVVTVASVFTPTSGEVRFRESTTISAADVLRHAHAYAATQRFLDERTANAKARAVGRAFAYLDANPHVW